MNRRTMKRQAQKAAGIPLRKGPAKGSTGESKGPARSPSRHEVFMQMRAASKAEAARAAAQFTETKAA